ncbi:MAG: 3-phosphoglycerate dehydrogenase [Firmicutes bacterium]|nr:3-phosphoglycerate dehydrogenase [Bacillota bacterium]
MYNILTLNKISNVGLEQLTSDYAVSDDCKNPDGILLRSFKMHDMELPETLKAVARCGAGVNNIPLDKCAEKGIVVFNTPGANANAVKELVLTGLLISSRKIVDGCNWAQSLKGTEGVAAAVEKGKAQFVGPEIYGKTLGIIGLGAIGVLVANAAVALGMKVYGFDPYLSVNAAWNLDRHVVKAASMDEIFAESDYITVHVPLTPDTKETFNAENLAKCKDGVRILNFSRGELANNKDMIAAIESGKVARYVVDFPSEETVGVDGIIALPHLGASTPEAEDNCAAMAAKELMDYLENGNIVNSVNYPNCSSPRIAGKDRICILHKDVPAIIGAATGALGEKGINISHMTNNSKGDYAYTILDTAPVDEATVEKIKNIANVISVRVLKYN